MFQHVQFANLDTTLIKPLMNPRGGTVGVSEILAQIDREIAQLQHARSVLGGKAAPQPRRLRQPLPPRNPSREGRRRGI
jgi:hypothetical protein